MTLHIRGCWRVKEPKRSDVRVSKRKQDEVKRDLQSSISIPENEKVRQRRSTLHWIRD